MLKRQVGEPGAVAALGVRDEGVTAQVAGCQVGLATSSRCATSVRPALPSALLPLFTLALAQGFTQRSDPDAPF